MIHEKNTAPRHEPPAEETPHGCYRGLVFISHLVEEDGEDVEVFEAVPCRRCSVKA
ncbi:MAG: hypothetical protein H0U04_05415 [Rubrobacter sp.]|nr:hypothetical protein [Rubrobacter sp.]